METRKVMILQDTMAGGEFVKKGTELELFQNEAHILTNIGRATYTDRMMEPSRNAPRATDTTEMVKNKKKK